VAIVRGPQEKAQVFLRTQEKGKFKKARPQGKASPFPWVAIVRGPQENTQVFLGTQEKGEFKKARPLRKDASLFLGWP